MFIISFVKAGIRSGSEGETRGGRVKRSLGLYDNEIITKETSLDKRYEIFARRLEKVQELKQSPNETPTEDKKGIQTVCDKTKMESISTWGIQYFASSYLSTTGELFKTSNTLKLTVTEHSKSITAYQQIITKYTETTFKLFSAVFPTARFQTILAYMRALLKAALPEKVDKRYRYGSDQTVIDFRKQVRTAMFAVDLLPNLSVQLLEQAWRLEGEKTTIMKQALDPKGKPEEIEIIFQKSNILQTIIPEVCSIIVVILQYHLNEASNKVWESELKFIKEGKRYVKSFFDNLNPVFFNLPDEFGNPKSSSQVSSILNHQYLNECSEMTMGLKNLDGSKLNKFKSPLHLIGFTKVSATWSVDSFTARRFFSRYFFGSIVSLLEFRKSAYMDMLIIAPKMIGQITYDGYLKELGQLKYAFAFNFLEDFSKVLFLDGDFDYVSYFDVNIMMNQPEGSKIADVKAMKTQFAGKSQGEIWALLTKIPSAGLRIRLLETLTLIYKVYSYIRDEQPAVFKNEVDILTVYKLIWAKLADSNEVIRMFTSGYFSGDEIQAYYTMALNYVCTKMDQKDCTIDEKSFKVIVEKYAIYIDDFFVIYKTITVTTVITTIIKIYLGDQEKKEFFDDLKKILFVEVIKKCGKLAYLSETCSKTVFVEWRKFTVKWIFTQTRIVGHARYFKYLFEYIEEMDKIDGNIRYVIYYFLQLEAYQLMTTKDTFVAVEWWRLVSSIWDKEYSKINSPGITEGLIELFRVVFISRFEESYIGASLVDQTEEAMVIRSHIYKFLIRAGANASVKSVKVKNAVYIKMVKDSKIAKLRAQKLSLSDTNTQKTTIDKMEVTYGDVFAVGEYYSVLKLFYSSLILEKSKYLTEKNVINKMEAPALITKLKEELKIYLAESGDDSATNVWTPGTVHLRRMISLFGTVAGFFEMFNVARTDLFKSEKIKSRFQNPALIIYNFYHFVFMISKDYTGVVEDFKQFMFERLRYCIEQSSTDSTDEAALIRCPWSFRKYAEMHYFVQYYFNKDKLQSGEMALALSDQTSLVHSRIFISCISTSKTDQEMISLMCDAPNNKKLPFCFAFGIFWYAHESVASTTKSPPPSKEFMSNLNKMAVDMGKEIDVYSLKFSLISAFDSIAFFVNEESARTDIFVGYFSAGATALKAETTSDNDIFKMKIYDLTDQQFTSSEGSKAIEKLATYLRLTYHKVNFSDREAGTFIAVKAIESQKYEDIMQFLTYGNQLKFLVFKVFLIFTRTLDQYKKLGSIIASQKAFLTISTLNSRLNDAIIDLIINYVACDKWDSNKKNDRNLLVSKYGSCTQPQASFNQKNQPVYLNRLKDILMIILEIDSNKLSTEVMSQTNSNGALNDVVNDFGNIQNLVFEVEKNDEEAQKKIKIIQEGLIKTSLTGDKTTIRNGEILSVDQQQTTYYSQTIMFTGDGLNAEDLKNKMEILKQKANEMGLSVNMGGQTSSKTVINVQKSQNLERVNSMKHSSSQSISEEKISIVLQKKSGSMPVLKSSFEDLGSKISSIHSSSSKSQVNLRIRV